MSLNPKIIKNGSLNQSVYTHTQSYALNFILLMYIFLKSRVILFILLIISTKNYNILCHSIKIKLILWIIYKLCMTF